MKTYAIILASGKGIRFGGDIPKQFIEYKGKTILEHSIFAFEQNENTDEIIVVIITCFNTFYLSTFFKTMIL